MRSSFSPTELIARRNVAAAVAREAGMLQRRRFLDRSGVGRAFDFKGHQDYLTATDGEVERLVRGRLLEAFPQDAVMGEEDGGALGDVTWIIDPIDGTANFARGIPHFCVSIGLVANGVAEVGAIYQPMTDELYLAATGQGATLDGEPMRVTDIDRADRASVEIGWSPRVPFATHNVIINRVAALGMRIRHGGSGSMAMAYVACGRVDAFVEIHINSWDVLAGLVLVREAGGTLNDFIAGGRGLSEGNPILASAPGIAAMLSEASGIS